MKAENPSRRESRRDRRDGAEDTGDNSVYAGKPKQNLTAYGSEKRRVAAARGLCDEWNVDGS